MKNDQIDDVIRILKKEVKKWEVPVVTEVSRDRSPFKVLISCMLSLRTKDEVTREASKRLFKLAETPIGMQNLDPKTIENAIYPVGFYKTKTKNIINVSKTLIEKYSSKVPDDIDELLKLRGVGRKTANLVITLGYNKLGICVDTHVHRISNRLGYVSTKTPKETEFALRKKLPQKYWIIYNDLLVTYGQNICKPISPFCSICKIERYCDKVGVLKSR
jgi:endonuclease-3